VTDGQCSLWPYCPPVVFGSGAMDVLEKELEIAPVEAGVF
jgi:hypothetical protein